MKKLITFLILLFAVSAYSGTLLQIQESIIAKKRGVASCDTSNIIFWYRCESDDFTATNGTLDYSAASPIGTLVPTAAINTDAVKYGTNGLDIPTAYDYIYFTTPSATLDDDGRVGIWIRITTFSDTENIFTIYANNENVARLVMSGTDELQSTWLDSNTARTALTTTDANLATGTWYFIEFAWKTSTNYREIFVNGVSKGSSSAAISSFAVAVTTIYYGTLISSENVDYHLDNTMISVVSTDDFYTVCKDETEWPE